MINHSLQLFCNRVVAAGRITAADVEILGRDVLPDGISHADEADMLIALDRAVPKSDASYADLVSAAVVNFAVWGERPTGYVDIEIARWLVGSLRSDAGPTPVPRARGGWPAGSGRGRGGSSGYRNPCR